MQNFITNNGQQYSNQKSLINALYDYCIVHRNPKSFYLSRTFGVAETVSGKFYEVSLTFDKSEILTSVKFKEVKQLAENFVKTPEQPYRLYATNYVDCDGVAFENNQQVLAHLKKHEGEKFTLSINGGERVWAWYADGLLWYGNKSYEK